MPKVREHKQVIDAWLARLPKAPSHAEVTVALDVALKAIWRRAAVTLGQVTMVAIGDRVVHSVQISYPWMSAVTVDETGLAVGGLAVALVSEDVLLNGARALLTELMTLLCHLTGDVLSPALHAALTEAASMTPSAEISRTDKKGTS